MPTAKPIAIAGVLAVVLAAAPAGALPAQVKPGQDSAARRTWGVNPGPARVTALRRFEVLADTAFIREATTGNLLEVRLAGLARSRADDSDVKEFAQRMATDHGSMQEQWDALIMKNGLPIEASLGSPQEREVRRLEGLSGAAFDRAYMASMIRDHKKDAGTFQRMEPSLHSSDVRRLAASGLATILEHLTMARQVGSRIGASPVVAAVTPASENRDTRGRDREVRRDVEADRDFLREMVADHVLEVRLAERARREARNAETRRLAEHMVADFSDWRDRWSALASRNDVKVSSHLGHLHQQKLDRLEEASNRDLDRTYAAIVAENLGSIAPYFQKEGRSAHSGAVRRLVEKELPLIRERLAQARRLAGESSDRADASRDGR